MTPFDLIVLGAGPAGGQAALAAAEAGLRVAMVDEQTAIGGQVWRLGSARRSEPAGRLLRERISASPVTCLLGRRVWSIGGAFRVDMIGAAGNQTIEASLLIAATGAHERGVPFPGWTLLGVIGLAAATVLLAQTLGMARERVGAWTMRPPLRPVPLADLMGRFEYGDIPIPAPAPL